MYLYVKIYFKVLKVMKPHICRLIGIKDIKLKRSV